MLARPDSSAIPGPSAASAAAFPAWARALHAPESEAEAGFLAGAALARLDPIVRETPPWAGAWRDAAKTRRRCATRSTSAGRAQIVRSRISPCRWKNTARRSALLASPLFSPAWLR
jgi:hypothetical protein